MPRKHAIGFILLVLIPALLVGWLGVKVSYDDRDRVRQNILSLLQARLTDTKVQIDRILQQIERRLLRRLERWDGSTEWLRELQRKHPLVRQSFLVNAQGALQHPLLKGELTPSERDFFKRTQPIWEGKAILLQPDIDQERWGRGNTSPRGQVGGRSQRPGTNPFTNHPGQRSSGFQVKRYQKKAPAYQQQNSKTPAQAPARKDGWGDSIQDLAAGRPHGWIVWYWAEGLHLLFWKRTPNGRILGVEVDRIVLLAQIVGQLPDSNLNTQKQPGRMILRNARGSSVYQWGHYQVRKDERALVRQSLSYPLHAWHLVYLGPESKQLEGLSGRLYLDLVLMLSGVVLGLLALAYYLYREFSRDMREASQRVTFVTQVSHELKTPLTNIRLYAELLESRLPEEDSRMRRHVGVIVAESQRLSRLINNILTFSRQHRHQHKVHIVPCQIDEVIERTLEQFAPTFAVRGIEVEKKLQAPVAIPADPDALEQILSNLLSNVEKYGVSGKYVSVTSHQDDTGQIRVEVADRGPGVPASVRETIFQPFVRGSDKLSDGVTGTGIGLTIARDLARLQGGDLFLFDSEVGARFALLLPGAKENSEPR